MLLFSSVIWLWLLQVACASPFSNLFGSNASPSKTTNPSSWRQRRTERLARRENLFRLKTLYSALAKDHFNQDGIKEAQDWIEQRLKDLGKDPKFVILLRGPEDGEIVGWGGLELDEQSSNDLAGLSNIQSVTVDEAPRKRLIARKRDVLDEDNTKNANATVLEKRALDWDQLSWKKTDAPANLIDISRWRGRDMVALDDFTYESKRGKRSDGKGIYIYIIEEGIQVDVKYRDIPEFPHREQTIYTDHCIYEGHNNENDEDPESHGTTVASVTLGQFHGVAKSATLVSVKYWDTLSDMADALFKTAIHIRDNDRKMNSIIVLTVGATFPTDPVKVRDSDAAASDAYRWISALHDFGVPVITPAGNDRQPQNGNPGRDTIDFWPSNWEGPNFPLINVAETDLDGIRTKESQAGTQVTTWASSDGAWAIDKDGISEQNAGTSLGCGIVAGLIAGFMAFDEPPWGPATGRERVEAIRQFIRTDENSGWKRDDKEVEGNMFTGERVIWNGAKEAYHINAMRDPEMPNYPDDEGSPSPISTSTTSIPTQIPEPPKGDPKSLQIIYKRYTTSGAEKWQSWNFLEGVPGTSVKWCDNPTMAPEDKSAPEVAGWNAPFPDGNWPLRPSGYAEDCTYQGLGEQRPDGDVGWLHCPERPAIKCLPTPEMSHVSDMAWADCSSDPSDNRFAVAYCNWE